MPTFKGKDGKPRFSMNPQMGKSMYGDQAAPGMDLISGQAGTDPAAGLDDNGESDSVEVHHGGSPDGQPEPHEGTAYHTIHKGIDGNPKEIRNHDTYDQAADHAREVMDPGEAGNDNNDDGDADDLQGGEASSFE
jgi:hypothetical protein